MKNYTFTLLLVLIAIAYGCKTPYQPQLVSPNTNYLVVDGVINDSSVSTDSTTIKLSRTTSLTKGDALVPELHAQVFVEDAQGFTFALNDAGKGNYVAGPLGLTNTKQYRIRIRTADGKIYLSDLTTAVYTPPIDSIGYIVSGSIYQSQVTIYASTHNPNNNTRNYRWDFGETWEFRAPYTSSFMSDGMKIVPRDAAHEFPVRCWNSDVSTNIVLASSSKLVSDVIFQQPITYIGVSQKLSVRYSILVKQYGLSDDAFKFWQQMQKNTEQLGSIFDAQPSQINGNIHCTTNALEPVFGYISITNVQTKRIYINRLDLPANFLTRSLANSCSQDSVLYTAPPPHDVNTVLIPYPGAQEIPLAPIFGGSGGIVGYLSANPPCVDCSLSGSKVPPSFWKEQ